MTRREMIKLATAWTAGVAIAVPSSAPFGRRNLVGMMGVMMDGRAKNLTARDYVQDGLIAMWDGIENAGFGVHDASATVWTDLAGSNNLTINSGSWGDDTFVFPSSAGGRPVASCSAIYNVMSYECVIRPTSFDSYNVVFCDGAGAEYYRLLVVGSRYTQTAKSPLYAPCNVSNRHYYSEFSGNTTSSALMVDGQSVGTSTINDNWSRTGMTLGYFDGRYIYKGDVCAIRFYNRYLTATEVAANFAVDKARFGLT